MDGKPTTSFNMLSLEVNLDKKIFKFIFFMREIFYYLDTDNFD